MSKPTSAKASAGRYFKYAIGEILLVVIGILIALQINNWNEDNKSKLKEQQLFVNMLANLNDELKLFKEVDSMYIAHDDVHYNLYNTYKGTDSINSDLRYGILRWNMGFAPTFKDNYQNKIDQISNDVISTAVLNYFRVQDQTNQVINLFETSKATLLRPYATNNNIMNLDVIFNPDRTQSIDPKFSLNREALMVHLQKPEFMHIITDLRIKAEAGARNLNYLREANLELQDILNRYLND